MKVRGLREVVGGPKVGETVDLDTATVNFFKSIGAVEVVTDEPPVKDEQVKHEPVKHEPAPVHEDKLKAKKEK